MADNVIVTLHPDPRTDALLRETERKLRRQNQVVVDLARHPSVQAGDLPEALREIAKAATETLDVDRVSIWFFTEDRQAIECREEYIASTGRHQSGGEVATESSPVYFHVLESERTVSIHDAEKDPRTAAFTEQTLRSAGVRSALDASVRRLGKVTAVVRHTAMSRRHWTVDEEHFAASIGDLVALAIDAAEKREAQKLLQQRFDFERLLSRISTRLIDLGPGDLDEAINSALASVGRVVGANATSVLLVDEGGLTASMKYEWCAPGVASRMTYVQGVATRVFFWFPHSAETMRPIHIEAKPAGGDTNEHALVEAFAAQSLLIVPIAVRRDLLGVFTVASSTAMKWDDETTALLRVVANTLAGAMNRARSEHALRESEMRYRLLADYSTDLISRIDSRGTILYTSPAVSALLGFEPAELTGKSVFEMVNPQDREVVRLATLTLARRGTLTFSFRVTRVDGKERWFESTCRGIKSEGKRRLAEIVAVSRDVSERKRFEEHIEFQAYHDDLTGLPNRSLFRDRLTVALAYARRTHRPLAVLFIDLDNFKEINDTLGHAAGDALLKTLAGRLSSVTRAEDTIARAGGDEFTVLATNLSSPEDASLVAEKVLEAISQPAGVEDNEVLVGASIGVAIYPQDGETVENLLTNADGAMYQAKQSGRNMYKLCTPEMNRRAAERLALDAALRRAIEQAEFSLQFQPLIRLDTMATTGMEALLRWNSPDRGPLEPAQFLGVAEETRMIVPLAQWTLREACRRAAQWQESMPGVRLIVNLSPRQFQYNELRLMIVEALEAAKLDPHLLEIDITNGAAMLHNERTTMSMRDLRSLGIRLAIDDFGTGQSTLNSLHDFPIDAVKIDRTFVSGIETNASRRAIISGVVVMARGLSLRVTAEGVETQAQLDFLRVCGCEEAQGFFLGRPVSFPGE